MRKRELEQFRKILLDLRARIGGDLGELQEEARRESETESDAEDYADAGSDSADREVSLNLLEHEQTSLRDVEEAIKRLDDGTYGVCQECDAPINIERLKAKPFARYCIDCKRKKEASERR